MGESEKKRGKIEEIQNCQRIKSPCMVRDFETIIHKTMMADDND